MADNDKIVGKDASTNSYFNGNGEHLKFTESSMSIYSNDPREPHSAMHLNVDHDKGTFTVTTHNEDKSEKSSNTGNCFLTSACMKHFQEIFDDNCQELTILRWFRDKFVSQEDIKHYYKIAPTIVTAIDNDPNNQIIYDYIYENVIYDCIEAIKNGDYNFAYNRYKESILALEEQFARKEFQTRLVRSLKKIN